MCVQHTCIILLLSSFLWCVCILDMWLYSVSLLFHVTIVLAHAWFACGSDGRRGISLTGDDQGGEGCRISGTRKSIGASACRCTLQHAIHSRQSWSAGELTSPQNAAPTREAGMCLGPLRVLDFFRHLKGFRILRAEGFSEILEAGWQHTGIGTWSFS
jgi:hypothetical protein